MTDQKLRLRQLLLILDVVLLLALMGTKVYEHWSFFYPRCKTDQAFMKNLHIMPDAFIDYVKFIEVASLAQSPQRDNLYDPAVQANWLINFLGPNDPGPIITKRKLNPAYYTPPYVAMMIPWTLLPISLGYKLWCIKGTVLAILTTSLLMVRFPVLPDAPGPTKPAFWGTLLMFWVVVLSSPASIQNYFLGQSALYMVALLAAFYYFWQTNHPLLAGVMIAFTSIIKPHHSLQMALIAFADRQWKTLIAWVTTMVVLLGASAMIISPQAVLSYPSMVKKLELMIDEGKLYNPITTESISLRGPLTMVLGSGAHPFAWLFWVMGLGLNYYIWRKAIKAGPHTYGYALASSVLVSLLLSFHANFYDLLMLAVPWALTVYCVGFHNLTKVDSPWQRAWCVGFFLFPFVGWAIMHYCGWYDGVPLHVPLMAVLLAIALTNFFRLCAPKTAESVETPEERPGSEENLPKNQ
jgi:hypothetical protein